MLATGLALLLVLAPAGAPGRRAQPPRRPTVAAQRLSPENAMRARAGLLPRKAASPPRSNRSKRSVYRPGPPTFLAEPTGESPHVVVAGVEPDPVGNPVRYPAFAASIHGVEVRWMIIRHYSR